MHPAKIIHKIKIVLRLILIRLRRRTELESGSQESKFVDAGG